MNNAPRPANPQDRAAVYFTRVLKIYDRWVLGFSNRYAWFGKVTVRQQGTVALFQAQQPLP